MNLGYRVQQNKMNINVKTEDSFEFDEDDVFYAEIKRQILLLTADEDEDEKFLGKNRSRSHSFKKQRPYKSAGLIPSPIQYGTGNPLTRWENEDCYSEAIRTAAKPFGNGNGTGVFIPQIRKSNIDIPGM